MTDPLDDCPFCGDDSDRAFVKYHADPNDAQMRTDWFEGLPLTAYAIVCQTCGEPVVWVDPREADELPDFEDLPHGTSAGHEFRVDEELK